MVVLEVALGREEREEDFYSLHGNSCNGQGREVQSLIDTVSCCRLNAMLTFKSKKVKGGN